MHGTDWGGGFASKRKASCQVEDFRRVGKYKGTSSVTANVLAMLTRVARHLRVSLSAHYLFYSIGFPLLCMLNQFESALYSCVTLP